MAIYYMRLRPHTFAVLTSTVTETDAIKAWLGDIGHNLMMAGPRAIRVSFTSKRAASLFKMFWISQATQLDDEAASTKFDIMRDFA